MFAFMKKYIFITLAVAAVFCTGFRVAYEISNKTAEANKVDGLFVFTDSQPVKDYEKLGEVKLTLSLGSAQYSDLRDKLIKKAKKDYPQCEAVICYFHTGSTDRAEAIKFK